MRILAVLTVVLMISFTAEAQVDKGREIINGEVNVGKDGQDAGINVFNMSSKQYVFTNNKGEFKIPVKVGDTLVFSSVQYQQFTVIITESVRDKGKLTINLNEGDTQQLEEVVVTANLSGFVNIDVKKLTQGQAYLTDINTDRLINGHYDFKPDRLSTVKNEAIDKGYLQNGLKFRNIFRSLYNTLFGSNHAVESPKAREEIEVQIQKLYSDDFFQKHLNIKKENIGAFIYYMKDHGLDADKILNTNPLELVQFLIEGSNAFHARQNSKLE